MALWWVATLAAVGALARWVISDKLALLGWWPWGTLIVNVVGSMLAGSFYVLSYEYQFLPSGWREGLLIGFCGALTTYSTWSLEIIRLIDEQAWARASLVFFLNNLLALTGCGIAVFLTRQAIQTSH